MKKIMMILGIAACLVSLNSCAYQDTMDERNREGVMLQNELNSEIRKGQRLLR